MYYKYTQEELRSFCRQNIENFEIWARNLIHSKMKESYGSDYINYKMSDGNFLIKKEVRDHVSRVQKQNPSENTRIVDTLFIDHIIYILCHDSLYKPLFKEVLDETYPDGKYEAHTILTRLIPIRNNLSHAKQISIRQVEQAICYTHDFIEGVKAYYKKKGNEKMWNVPSIIKITDSLGNVYDCFNESPTCVIKIQQEMNVGDSYFLEIEVDPSFDKNEYNITWAYRNKDISELKNKTRFEITFSTSDVSKENYIHCTIVQNEDWHKYNLWDFRVLISFTVLPPKT